ncbi:MAG: uroporphyrinogen-III C-methyltransferase [Alphaproteobacteria bacterium]|nr:uroporphyrinogen-III C-methyltransferase [Alphaproteobacteria bacterium]
MTDQPITNDVQQFFDGLPRLQSGWVWLAGSGPGDPGLITVQLLVGLASADVVVHDALVSDDILGLVPPNTLIHYAGKCGGKPSVLQADITEALIQYAREDRKVLRLKGGDPMMFGRGAEEAQALVNAGIPFRILPGVTSGMAAPSYAGIPLTHRGLSSSVSFITGHGASGNVPNMNWTALAQGADMLVFFMAMKHLSLIQQNLLRAGLPPGHPAGLISNGTLPGQKVRLGTLGALPELAADIEPPAIIVVGEAVRLAQQLSWLPSAQEHSGVQLCKASS